MFQKRLPDGKIGLANVNVLLNIFQVISIPGAKVMIYQYDVRMMVSRSPSTVLSVI